jgi:site-specific DNA recombinase
MRNAKRSELIRCAIYTRKSTEEGLNQEFNSLDAQRESGEAFIASQKNEGWDCLATRYDDGGFTGGNMDRPALRRLMADIEAGKIDCIVVYKVDRLSRSLLDFAQIIGAFDKHGVSFVSVTQQFNTTSSMGRLTLNILLSFAQFEREIISERTRDKMAAARKRGKYVGGAPVLGYDIEREKSRLIVNEREAFQVRQIFELYLEHESLLRTVAELDRRGLTTKRWTTKKGKLRGGRSFNKNTLYALLTNVVFIGKVHYHDELYEGEHEGIVDAETFERVKKLLRLNNRTGGKRVRNKFGALLKGRLFCTPCGCAMSHSHTTRNRTKRYRYYVCVNAQKRGWANCPSKSVPAAEIERFVVDQIRGIGQDPGLVAATLAQARKQSEQRAKALDAERRGLVRQRERDDADLRAASLAERNTASIARSADLLERIGAAQKRIDEIDLDLDDLRHQVIDEKDVAGAMAEFDALWESLSPRERSRVIELLIERVDYDGDAGTVAVSFRPTGFKQIAKELEETAA